MVISSDGKATSSIWALSTRPIDLRRHYTHLRPTAATARARAHTQTHCLCDVCVFGDRIRDVVYGKCGCFGVRACAAIILRQQCARALRKRRELGLICGPRVAATAASASVFVTIIGTQEIDKI